MKTSNIHLLLIEDDAEDAELTIHALKKPGLDGNLVHIDDGSKALNFLFDENNTRPTLILLDLRMPRVDGIQILRRLKSDESRRTIPVIAFISSPEGQQYVESFNVQADGYLQKPLDPERLLAIMDKLGLSHDGK